MGYKFNIFLGGLDQVGAAAANPFFGPPVNNETDLPLVGNDGELRVVKNTRSVYEYDTSSSTWKNVTHKFIDAVGASPSPEGLTQSEIINVDGILETHLQLQPADSTNPGVITASTQSIGGTKTFDNVIKVTNGIDASTPAGTLSIGITDADTINIGHSGATVNIIGTTNTVNVTNYNVTDKNITINSGGPAASGAGAGLEVEENALITGYNVVSPGRNAWNLKAPSTAGIVSIIPGASGFNIDQGSHNPLSLSTPGLGISLDSSNQILSAQYASGSQPGLLSSTDYSSFSNKAERNLSNLTSTSINQTLLPSVDGSIDLGSALKTWNQLFINAIQDTGGNNFANVNSRILYDSSNNPALTFSGTQIDVNNRVIGSVATPVANQDAANKLYVTNQIAAINRATRELDNLTTTAINASLVPDTDVAYSIGEPTARWDGYFANFFDENNNPAVVIDSSTRDLRNTSGTLVASFSGSNLDVSNNKITNLAAPTINLDATNKLYVDTQIGQAFINGDIAHTSFSGANNQASPANITLFTFNGAITRSFEALVSIHVDAATPLYEVIRVQGINKGSSFEISQSSTGDSSGVLLSITNAGQIQYTSNNYTGFNSLNIRFRAITTTV